MSDRVVQVPIGGIAVARPPQILTTLLGSCVGMVILDPKHFVVVLAHVVRPEGTGMGMGDGYFANLAAPRARDLALQNGADPRQLIVKMAGGGSMGAGLRGDIGRRNASAIKELTYELGMVFGGHVSGPADGGCVLSADPANAHVDVHRLGGGELGDRQWHDVLQDVVK